MVLLRCKRAINMEGGTKRTQTGTIKSGGSRASIVLPSNSRAVNHAFIHHKLSNKIRK